MSASPWGSGRKNKEDTINVRKSKRSSNKRDQKLETNMQIPEHFTALSIWMSKVLDDIGASMETVMERRKTFLKREYMMEIGQQLDGIQVQCFHFGSQSEGTTIPGLQSDIDILISYDGANIMRFWRDWKAGMQNLLMLHDDFTPPQQYLLQVVTPEPEMYVFDDKYARKDSGQVLLSAERFKQSIAHMFSQLELGEVTINGPSVSYIPNWDIVKGYTVRKPLTEIQRWIDRCRGSHWPPVQLLEAARVAPCFLVPAGHPDSDYKREEWRLSPNLIERMLMFSFNITQIKCYIVLKLIKKSLFTKIVGDSITSYHCKTVMFYTIEKTQPSMWCEHNLMFLLGLCLHVLKKSLRLGRLPHYIIEGANLFDGKLSKVQQRRCIVYIDSIIKNNLQYIFCMGIDKIGSRLKACDILQIGQTQEVGRVCLRNGISLSLKFKCLDIFLQYFCKLKKELVHSSYTTFEHDIKYKLRTIFEYPTNARLKPVFFRFIKHLYLLKISNQISNRLQLGNVLDSESIRRVQYSINSDVASSLLKLASILYCSRHIHAAVRVLEDVERRYNRRVQSVCGCRESDCDVEVFTKMILSHIDKGFGTPQFAFCVKFYRQEKYCAPFILWFEMKHNITAVDMARVNHETCWMESAEVDARPFLYYLQYLTYRELGERHKQLHSLRVLHSLMCDTCGMGNKINLNHNDTALHLLGHCHEMEGEYEQALQCYEAVLRSGGTNNVNAANWHVRRVLHIIRG